MLPRGTTGLCLVIPRTVVHKIYLILLVKVCLTVTGCSFLSLTSLCSCHATICLLPFICASCRLSSSKLCTYTWNRWLTYSKSATSHCAEHRAAICEQTWVLHIQLHRITDYRFLLRHVIRFLTPTRIVFAMNFGACLTEITQNTRQFYKNLTRTIS